MMKKLAVLDFDQTLSKGFISMAFLDYLKDKNIYPEKNYAAQMTLLERYRKGELSYDEWCKEWGDEWAKGLRGRSCDEIYHNSKRFFDTYRKNIFPKAYDLIDSLKRDHTVMLLSVGASEVINLAGIDLGAEMVYASRMSAENDFYTGKMETSLHLPGGKAKQLLTVLAGGMFDEKQSSGYGDSDSDIEFIEMLGKKFAVNPNDKLKEHAERNRNNGWRIISLSDSYQI
jgi:phosphoserine phosphatase